MNNFTHAQCRRLLHGITAIALFTGLMLTGGMSSAKARENKREPKTTAAAKPALPAVQSKEGVAEARLIEIYNLIGQGANREAFLKAEKLAEELPHFQLAQLVYGDLLVARTRPLNTLGDVPTAMAQEAAGPLKELREESLRRVKALKERPVPGTIPSQFLQLAPSTRHAIAVDASRSRLYLFENTATGLQLVADYYISVGKAGTLKSVEGDQRTPLGVYYITSNLDRKSLKDFYGSGACPSATPTCSMPSAARPAVASGCMAHHPPSSRARPWLPTAASCWPTLIWTTSSGRWRCEPHRS